MQPTSSVSERCSPRAAQRRPVVLCVDDDPDITRVIEQVLSNYDVEVVRSAHGQQGIWNAVRRHPDLIITDLRMPCGSGEELVECLKRNTTTANIPIIVLSGQRGDHLPGRMRNMGVDGFLRKPVHHATLREEIEKFIALREVQY